VIALCSKLDGLTVIQVARKLESAAKAIGRRGVRAEQIIAPPSRRASRPGVELERAKAKVMPFGKHRGKRLAQVPEDYLQWCLRQCSSLRLALREAIRLVLK
jgi:hypothetical protein